MNVTPFYSTIVMLDRYGDVEFSIKVTHSTEDVMLYDIAFETRNF